MGEWYDSDGAQYHCDFYAFLLTLPSFVHGH